MGLIDKAKTNAALMKEGSRLVKFMKSVDDGQQEIAKTMNENFKVINDNIKELAKMIEGKK